MEAVKYSTKSYWLPKRHDSTVTETVLIKLKVSCTLGREDEEDEDVNSRKYNCKLERIRWEGKYANHGDVGLEEKVSDFYMQREKI